MAHFKQKLTRWRFLQVPAGYNFYKSRRDAQAMPVWHTARPTGEYISCGRWTRQLMFYTARKSSPARLAVRTYTSTEHHQSALTSRPHMQKTTIGDSFGVVLCSGCPVICTAPFADE